MTGRAARLAAWLALAVAASSCGAPSAQVIGVEDSPFSYEVPTDFAILDEPEDPNIRVFGPAGSEVEEYGSDPILLVISSPDGELASFTSLRSAVVGGQFDPLDQDDPRVAEQLQVLGYTEIAEPDVWGIRLQFLTGPGASDVQVLVDRRSDQVSLTRMFCGQACFADQAELIDQIQASWSLDP